MTTSFPAVADLPAHADLQNPLGRIGDDGAGTARRDDWPDQREYLKDLLAHYLYGPMPPTPHAVDWSVEAEGAAVDGAATVEYVEVTVERAGSSTTIRVGLLRPDRRGPFPVVIKNDRFLFGEENPAGTDTGEREGAPELAPVAPERRDQQAFANEQAVKRGYALCKFAREDAAVDAPGRRDSGVFALYPEYREWGVIAAWAWTYRVLLDVLIDLPYVDPGKVVTTGHSRGGKTALCAAIYDDRVAVAAPNSSGSGGTGSWWFFDGDHDEQTVDYHEEHHARWWSPRFMEFVGREEQLPFDAHTLRAAVAPRAVLNTHARHDWWANPYGTALATHAAQPVFDWLGVGEHNAQHWRDGDHDQRMEDWAALFDFCDDYFFDRASERAFEVNPHPDRYEFDPSRFRYTGGE
jgi:hypothetical protein